MCGIIGYVGRKKASEVILEGLRALEYRGYDSVGIAVMGEDGKMVTKKDRGMLEEVSKKVDFLEMNGILGVGHTRWATHGPPSFENAHPHHDCEGKVVLVHNGVIENYLELREELAGKGHKFSSETDSEIVAHLIEEYRKNVGNFEAFRKAINRLKGSYAIACMIEREKKLFLARKNSPLIVGIGNGEMFCASDFTPMLKHTKTFVPMDEEEVAMIDENGAMFFDLNGKERKKKAMEVRWSAEQAEKGGYPHYMLKEIEEQRYSVKESFMSNVKKASELIEKYEKIDVIGAGTSYHAGLMLKYLFQKELKKKVDVVIASEYRYVAVPDKKTLVIAISQSGETADTLQAIKFAKKHGAKILAITNVVGSSIARVADETVYMNAGPEIGVAATKTFTSQLAIAYKLTFPEKDFSFVGDEISRVLEEVDEKSKETAQRLKFAKSVFFIGRGVCMPIAYEGALKFKEISYIHGEAYGGGELKHGPLSLIEKDIPVIALVQRDETYEKMIGSIKEVKARGAYVIAITDSEEIGKIVDEAVVIKCKEKILYPFYFILPLQLIAYHTSVERGINPDKPRNLAKSVTVE
ncbi:MAG: glutamine--fructose-6-phosphate transaminase (isomerizing) [Candidatus Anstonellales archaeon]